MARTGRARPKRKQSSTPQDAAPPDVVEQAAAPVHVAPEAVEPPPWRRGVRLGVDVGSVRVGLAACDPDGLVATAVETLRRDAPPPASRGRRRAGGGAPERDPAAVPDDVARIAAEVRERAAVEVVVGLPRSLSGQEGRAAGLARRYASALAEVVAPVPVRLVDERLSTAGAHRSLSAGGTGGRRARSVVDQVAAAWILQTALDLERRTGRPPGPRAGVPGGAAGVPAGAHEDGEQHDDQRHDDEQHDDEVGGRAGAPRTGEHAERGAQRPPVEEDASVSTGPSPSATTPPALPGAASRSGPRPGPPRRSVAADERSPR